MNVLERIKQQVETLKKSVRVNYGDDAKAINIVKEAARRIGIISPDTIEYVNKTETNPDKYDSDAAILLSGLNCAINDLISQNLWWECFDSFEDEAKGSSTAEIDFFYLPEDFGGFITSGFIGIYIPVDTPIERITEVDIAVAEIKEGSYDNFIRCFPFALLERNIQSGNPNVVGRFSILNDHGYFISALNPLEYTRYLCLGFYRSVYGVVNALEEKGAKYFKNDNDYSKIDPELLVRGAVLYYAQTMGLDTSIHMQRYAQYLQACQQNRANRNKIIDSSLSYNALTNRGRYG
jgi:hypothetical protein